MSTIKFTIILFLIFLNKSLGELITRQKNQYEHSEVLDHEDHRDIMTGHKTVFQPDKTIFARNRKSCGVFTAWNADIGIFDENGEEINGTTIGPFDDSEEEYHEDRLEAPLNVTKEQDQEEVTVEIENSHCGAEEKAEVFWHNRMSKEEVRMLQSKIMRKYMNPSINPCEDFYEFACGNWKNYFKIPPDRTSYDTFEIIRENLDMVLNQLLQTPKKQCESEPIQFNDLLNGDWHSNDTTAATTKAKWFYDSCMNKKALRKRGGKPLLDIIDLLGGWPLLSKEWAEKNYDLFGLLGKLRLLNNEVLISQWIGPDMKNANQYIVHIDQTTLGLPTREYFIDPKNIKYIRAYKILILGTVELLGGTLKDGEIAVDEMVDFETAIAEILASAEERRNISDIYLKTDLSSMTLYFPQYDWESYFNIILGPKVNLKTPVAVYCVKYLLELVSLLSNTEPRVIQNYIIWRFVRHRLNNLDSSFLDLKQRFNFVLYGREQQPKRWQFCVTQVNTHMGMAIGSLFVKKYFDKTSKTDTIKLTQALMGSFKTILRDSTWIDEHTKKYAKMKIDNMDLKIGFPDFVLNKTALALRYYDVIINPDTFFENVLSILRHLSRSEQKKLGSQVDRKVWSTSPAVVNAYYSRNKNQIMFPAGILQPPFYHKHFPKGMNFGGIGVVIGHEITHGFDDKGRLFDQQGNLMLWWRDSSIKNFYERAQCIIDQYSQFVLPQVKVPIDGYLTQGENIADNGGLKESFKAYKAWLRKNPSAEENLPDLNLTGKQLFFLNFAQVWCGQQRVEEVKTRMKTSVHSPGVFRIKGVLCNSQEFAREFKCPLNSPMNPEKKCSIW